MLGIQVSFAKKVVDFALAKAVKKVIAESELSHGAKNRLTCSL